MISKELLSEVMNIKIEDIVDLKMFGKELNYYEKCLLNFCGDGRLSKHKDSIYKSVNIYELAHKCKEWAFKQEYRIIIDCSKDIKVGIRILKNGRDIYSNENKSEQQIIFKACEYILKELSNK